MTEANERNQEYVESINKDKEEYLNSFVEEFTEELYAIRRTMESESSRILINWISDKLNQLHEDYNANL